MDEAITLPYGWSPRPYQTGVWEYLAGGGKNAVVIGHRRWGKDALALHHTCCAAHERVGSYLHMLPEAAQSRKALWSQVDPHTGVKRIDEAFPLVLRKRTLDDEMFIEFKNGSTWQLAGSDNYNSIVGTSYAGMVHSEYALANPAAQSYFQPILIENNGWQLFITTPRGKNHAHGMYQHALKQMRAGKDWYAELAPASKTHALDQTMLDDELERLQSLHGEDYGRALWLQEYFTSFDAAIPGSIWGDCIERMTREGRLGSVPLERGVEVCTAWDLGRTDATAVWWFQVALGSVRVIDYMEANFKDVPWWADRLREKAKERGFEYGTHYLPTDAKQQHMAAGGQSVHSQMIGQEVGRIQIIHDKDHVDGIQAARATFPYVWMDETRCVRGIEVLRHYHYEWDEEKKSFALKPEHDWASHGASAWRTMALAWKVPKAFKAGAVDSGPSQEALLRGSVAGMTFGQAKRAHLRKAAAARSESL